MRFNHLVFNHSVGHNLERMNTVVNQLVEEEFTHSVEPTRRVGDTIGR
jgi:hypothetical protein